ncbi:hypothetical protein [Altererythrobacter sp.]|uniref:hypothetical protein n=1 Tax=Altererythrobacter sp. TaxID=1872480 RepID=UPI003D0E2495
MQFLSENNVILQYLAIVVLQLAALRWGDQPERLCAALLVAMVIGEIILHYVVEASFVVTKVDAGHFAMSLGAEAGYLMIALYSNRVYPLWLASFQLISVLTHVARELSEGVTGTAYQLIVIAPSYFMILIVAGGIILHHKRFNRYGPYRAWRRRHSVDGSRP